MSDPTGRGFALRVGWSTTPTAAQIQRGPCPLSAGWPFWPPLCCRFVTVLFIPEVSAGLAAHQRQTFGLLAGASLIVAVGIADDRYSFRARYKVIGQLAAIMVLVLGGGFVIERVGMFGMMIELGLMAIPCTALWLLACVNALNLIDGMDGLLGIVGGIALVSLAVIVAMTGYFFEAIVARLGRAAVIGFLVEPAARIGLHGRLGQHAIGLRSGRSRSRRRQGTGRGGAGARRSPFWSADVRHDGGRHPAEAERGLATADRDTCTTS